jgi:predicted RNA-binding Zn-ribbon protein involved in translation (DUF1610 family)
MFIKTRTEIAEYTRVSKTGIEHNYHRKRTVAEFLCDNCGEVFERLLKHIQNKRLSNRYFHCCSKCDSKRFAQRKGVEQKKIWDMPAGLDWPVGKY